MCRDVLKAARKEKGMTQQAMAEYLSIDLRYYQKIESGESTGAFWLWDALEDFHGIHQRKLRELSNNRRVPAESQLGLQAVLLV